MHATAGVHLIVSKSPSSLEFLSTQAFCVRICRCMHATVGAHLNIAEATHWTSSILHCTIQYFTVLYCTVLYCTTVRNRRREDKPAYKAHGYYGNFAQSGVIVVLLWCLGPSLRVDEALSAVP